MRRKIAQLLKTASSVRQAAGILVVTAFASNVLGLVRNTVIAKNIPLAIQDDFWSAFLIPDIIFNVLIFGAISSAFIPLFRGLIVNNKKDDAWELAGNFFAKMSILIVSLAIVLFFFMPQLTNLLFPTLIPSDITLVITLSRILLIQTILMGWSYIVGGILNAKKRFLAYSLSPLLYNASMITGAFLAPYVGPEKAVVVLIWSVVIGALLHLLIQIPSVIAVGFRLRHLNLRPNQLIKEIMILMTPRSISLGIISLNTVLFAAIARNLLEPGALSIYKLVESFQTAPIAIFANAIAVALFPTLSEYAAKQDWQRFSSALIKAFRFVLFTLIPSTVLFIVLRAQIIRLYIGLGSEISWEDTIRAIEVFGWFAVGIVPTGLVAILARTFYALKNTIVPMFVAVFVLVFGVTTAYTLASNTGLDVTGLAIATTVTSLIQFILLYMAYLRVLKKPLPEGEILKTGWHTVLASLFMGSMIWWTLRFVDYIYINTDFGFTTRTIAGLFAQTTIALIVGLLAFILIARMFLKEELGWLKQKYRK